MKVISAKLTSEDVEIDIVTNSEGEVTEMKLYPIEGYRYLDVPNVMLQIGREFKNLFSPIIFIDHHIKIHSVPYPKGTRPCKTDCPFRRYAPFDHYDEFYRCTITGRLIDYICQVDARTLEVKLKEVTK